MIIETLQVLLVAIIIGGAIGLERTYNGRPAGFRTHILVCVSSALLMLVSKFQMELISMPLEVIRTDPTRIAQGIMTGIGFLGAGVIMKDGLTVRGLTTAASIWMTAALGIVVGIGAYWPAVISGLITLSVLVGLRKLEEKTPSKHYRLLTIMVDRKDQAPPRVIRDILAEHKVSMRQLDYKLTQLGSIEYSTVINTLYPKKFDDLAMSLAKIPVIQQFEISISR